jgi:hypothetical protein
LTGVRTGADDGAMTREPSDEDKAIADVIERLQARFPQTAEIEIDGAVRDAQRSFERARVRDFVPVLVEREARARIERPIR